MTTSTSLAACLINISEGRRHEVVWSIVGAACRAIEKSLKGSEVSLQINNGGSQLGKAVVLNTFVDKEYNRNEPINDTSYFYVFLYYSIRCLMVKIPGAW